MNYLRKRLYEMRKKRNTGTGEYIKNGLLFWVDGILNTESGHSETTNTWYDRISKINRKIYNYGYVKDGEKIPTIYWNNNKLIINSTGRIDNVVAQNKGVTVQSGLTNGAVKTIEITAEIPKYIRNTDGTSTTSKNSFIITCPFYNDGRSTNHFKPNVNFAEGCFRFQYINISNTIKTVRSYTLPTQKTTYCFTVEKNEANVNLKIYLNGILKQSLVLTDVVEGCEGFCCAYVLDNTSTKFSADVYAVRMYNRPLTSIEILNNYNTDLNRYGG